MKIIIPFLCVSLCLNASFPREVNEWQHVDPTNDFVFPWFTKPFLDLFTTWDMQEWSVFEWGTGYSTLWLANRCKQVVSVDNNTQWIQSVREGLHEHGLENVILKHRIPAAPYAIGDGGEESLFVTAIDEDDALYDCIIIDGDFHRNACAQRSLKHLKRGGILILDNANQATIGLDSSATFELLKDYPHFSFQQPGHPDWKTDFWIYTDKESSYDSLAGSEWTDHVRAFRQLFNLYPVTSFLEFGVGLGSQFYLENCQHLTSIELVLKDRYSFVVPWYIDCLDRFASYSNWSPSLHAFSQVVNYANELAISGVDPASQDSRYLLEINHFLDELFLEKQFQVAFVDPGIHIRGDLVNALFGRVDIIGAHDTNFNSPVYGWYKVVTPPDYEKISFSDGSGTTLWIKKDKQGLIDLLNEHAPAASRDD